MKFLLKYNKGKIAKGIKVWDTIPFGNDKDNEVKNYYSKIFWDIDNKWKTLDSKIYRTIKQIQNENLEYRNLPGTKHED